MEFFVLALFYSGQRQLISVRCGLCLRITNNANSAYGSYAMVLISGYSMDYDFSEEERLSLVTVTTWCFKLSPIFRNLFSLLPGILKLSCALYPSSSLIKFMDPYYRMHKIKTEFQSKPITET